MFYLTGFNTQVSFEHVIWVRVFQCVGLPLFFIPLNTIAYGNLPPGKNNNASAMMSLMRNLGGGIGISVAITLLTRRTQMHQERLASTATHFYQPFVHFMNSAGGFTQHNIDRLLRRGAAAGDDAGVSGCFQNYGHRMSGRNWLNIAASPHKEGSGPHGRPLNRQFEPREHPYATNSTTSSK